MLIVFYLIFPKNILAISKKLIIKYEKHISVLQIMTFIRCQYKTSMTKPLLWSTKRSVGFNRASRRECKRRAPEISKDKYRAEKKTRPWHHSWTVIDPPEGNYEGKNPLLLSHNTSLLLSQTFDFDWIEGKPPITTPG